VKKVLLIDGNSFCYRAFYAIKSLSTSKGQPTNAIYGFVTMLNKIITEHQPQYLAVTFDLKGPTFRHEKFTDYKIHRKPMPNELIMQLPIIKRIIQAYGIAIFEQQGYEADDIIATLAKTLTDKDVEVLILTSDKDMLQVVSKNIKVINPHKENEILDEAWVRKRFGVDPEKIVEIMALCGDVSDNIPGVPGIGEVTAIKLIKRFGSLDEVLANLDKITSKSRAEQIKRCASQARMSRELAKLDCNVTRLTKIDTSDLLAQLKTKEVDNRKLFEIFKELEFKSLIQKFAPKNKNKLNYKVISSQKEAEYYLKEIVDGEIALFTWNDHRHPMLAKIYGIAFFREKEEPLFFALRLISPTILKPVLENGDIKKIGHNLKYLKVLLSNYEIDLQGIQFDIMIASYLLEPAKLKYELKDLALEYLDCKIEEALGFYTEEKAGEICCQNAHLIFNLSKILQKQLKEKNLLSLFEDIEIPLIEILANMEKEGVTLNRNLLLHLSREFETKLKDLTKQIYEIAGQDFNINSPQQLSSILFEKLKLPIIKRTKTGKSTDTDVLQRLLSLHPIASALLEFRELSKMKSTYVDGMLKLLHTRTGKIHTSFNQTGTATGRLSCSQPNLQNIPIRTKLGKRIRQIFVPSGRDNLLLSADYSQIELRILAHLSGDKNLISAFQKNLDIHAYTASLIFGVTVHQITTQMRDTAKTVNFGIIYGMTAYGLSRDLGSEVGRAQEFIDAYFQRYPQVKSYIDRQKKQAERDGFVTTLLNRRRYIPQINSPDETTRKFAQRIAINAPVQGSASDLIKAAMVEIYRSLKIQGLLAKMIIQVHDELVFSVPEKELEEAKSLIKHRMENVIKLKVPIIVSIRTGKNWLEMK
jgi:DNA polymerase-1